MTGLGGDGGFSVATRSVGGGPRHGRGPQRLGIVVVLVGAAAIVGISVVGPRLSGPPNLDLSYFATPTPPASSASASPSASFRTPDIGFVGGTPLPTLTVPGGDTPSGQIALFGDDLQVLDLASGKSVHVAGQWNGSAVVLPDPATTGWLCLCLHQPGDGTTQAVSLLTFSVADGTRFERDVVAWDEPLNRPDGQQALGVDLDLRVDRRGGLIVDAIRRGDRWRFSARSVSLPDGATGAATTIGELAVPTRFEPSPAPTDENGGTTDYSYFDGPRVRLAPDGAAAIVTGTIHHQTADGTEEAVGAAWWVDLDPNGAVAGSRPIDAVAELSSNCFVSGFGRADRIVDLCIDFDPSGDGLTIRVLALRPDGTTVGELPVRFPGPAYFAEPIVDTANGRLYLWDPTSTTMHRIDLETVTAEQIAFDPAAAAAPGIAPAEGRPPRWGRLSSSLSSTFATALAVSPDGSRLYAVGVAPPKGAAVEGFASLGVFVLETRTLALLDRWAPVGNDAAVGALGDGRVVVAAQPHLDADGHNVPWDGSLTLRDPGDGRVIARYGRVSVDSTPSLLGG
jgi:hypothetical protein